MSDVSFEDVGFAYVGQPNVIERFSLAVPEGQFVSLLGPSGCGKSTLLRLVAGLLSPSKGRVRRGEGEFSFAFQDARLLPWRTVLENTVLPFELSGRVLPDPESVLRDVGLWDARDLFPHQLSGGMRQRAAIARALITRPRLLLMDEPFSALDEGTREDLEFLLHRLWQREGCTLVFVTHSVTEAVFLSERVIVLGRGGQLLTDRKIQFQSRPETLRTSTAFVHEIQTLSGDVRRAREGSW